MIQRFQSIMHIRWAMSAGCRFQALTDTFSIVSAVDDHLSKAELPSIYPNPANNLIYIYAPAINSKVSIVNAIGQTVFEEVLPLAQHFDKLRFVAGGIVCD